MTGASIFGAIYASFYLLWITQHREVRVFLYPVFVQPFIIVYKPLLSSRCKAVKNVGKPYRRCAHVLLLS